MSDLREAATRLRRVYEYRESHSIEVLEFVTRTVEVQINAMCVIMNPTRRQLRDLLRALNIGKETTT